MTRTRRYAEDTKVPVQKSLADIEKLVTRNNGDQFMSGWTEGHVHVAFRLGFHRHGPPTDISWDPPAPKPEGPKELDEVEARNIRKEMGR